MITFLSFLMVASLGLIPSAFASMDQAPPHFTFKGKSAVFVDFSDATYEITYDLKAKTASVASLIHFHSDQRGYPLFDLVPGITTISIDGKFTTAETIQDPDLESTLRVLSKEVSAGSHYLRIKHLITENVVFNGEGVASGFWIGDLTDRKFLEQYLPTNYEYDQYQMTIKVKVLGGQNQAHVLKANGEISKIAHNHFEVTYPAHYGPSAVFFHLFPERNTSTNVQFYYPSIDGRMIPVDIYTPYTNIQEWVDSTKAILAELEADYGPFPHPQVLVYGMALSGGMEYCGATATSLKSLGHELFHSYHAKGIIPANGNAGWMDEAIARFRDNKYPLTPTMAFPPTRLAGHSVWARKTDRMAYTEGSAFLSWIAYRMNEKGISLKGFLKSYFEEYKYSTVTTELFRDELSSASGMDLTADFDRYIYGKGVKKSHLADSVHEENPHHPHYSKEELLDLTSL